jgi:hypothetical protein
MVGSTLLQLVILAAVLVAPLLYTHLLGAYFTEKGKNTAQKEDLAELTKIVEEIRHEHTRSSEELKAALTKELNVHKTQYDAEVETYKEVWEKLVDLKRAVDDLGRSGRGGPEAERAEERYYDAHASFLRTVEIRRPFYPADVWHALHNVLETVHRIYSDSVNQYLQPIDRLTYYLTHGNELVRRIDAVCDAIQLRLRLVTQEGLDELALIERDERPPHPLSA